MIEAAVLTGESKDDMPWCHDSVPWWPCISPGKAKTMGNTTYIYTYVWQIAKNSGQKFYTSCWYCRAAPVILLGLRWFFSHIHVHRYVFVPACYFDMKSQDATLSSLNLRMSLRISLLLSKFPICLKLQLNFANLYVLLPARFLLATR